MDHSSPNVTLRYVAHTNSEKQKVADALNSVVQQVQTPKARGEIEAKKEGTVAAVPLCSLPSVSPNLFLIKSKG